MLVYLAGPITAKNGYTVEQNVRSALDVYFALIRAGVDAFSPQLGAAYPEAFDIDYERWMAYDFAMIDRCSHVLMLPRWKSSAGACRELEYAKTLEKTIHYHVDELLSAGYGHAV